MMRRLRSTASLTLVGLLLALAQSPAEAHHVDAYHGRDHAWVSADHHRAGIKDRECDGNPAYVEVMYRVQGRLWYLTWWDKGGCDPGVTVHKIPRSSLMMRACERAVYLTCTTWKNI